MSMVSRIAGLMMGKSRESNRRRPAMPPSLGGYKLVPFERIKLDPRQKDSEAVIHSYAELIERNKYYADGRKRDEKAC